ncbi:MAG: LysR family transcriptional regulator [Bacteroidales bacterium]
MAGPRGSKYYDTFLHYTVWLENRSAGRVVDEELIRLLKAIENSGSLTTAANSLGMSYRKAWGDLKKAAGLLGFPLVETARGGKEGGHTRLSEDGLELVQALDELKEDFNQAIYRVTRKFFHKINR